MGILRSYLVERHHPSSRDRIWNARVSPNSFKGLVKKLYKTSIALVQELKVLINRQTFFLHICSGLIKRKWDVVKTIDELDYVIRVKALIQSFTNQLTRFRQSHFLYFKLSYDL